MSSALSQLKASRISVQKRAGTYKHGGSLIKHGSALHKKRSEYRESEETKRLKEVVSPYGEAYHTIASHDWLLQAKLVHDYRVHLEHAKGKHPFRGIELVREINLDSLLILCCSLSGGSGKD